MTVIYFIQIFKGNKTISYLFILEVKFLITFIYVSKDSCTVNEKHYHGSTNNRSFMMWWPHCFKKFYTNQRQKFCTQYYFGGKFCSSGPLFIDLRWHVTKTFSVLLFWEFISICGCIVLTRYYDNMCNL